jgi:hypothetical protein
MDTDSVRSFTDEQVLTEFGKAMLAHSYGHYDFTGRMEVSRAEALRQMGAANAEGNLGRPLRSVGCHLDTRVTSRRCSSQAVSGSLVREVAVDGGAGHAEHLRDVGGRVPFSRR